VHDRLRIERTLVHDTRVADRADDPEPASPVPARRPLLATASTALRDVAWMPQHRSSAHYLIEVEP
jgi:hypothetical protein